MNKLLLILLCVPLIGLGQTAHDYCKKGNDYYDNGEYELAMENYNKAISINPDYPYAYCLRGDVYEDLKNYDYAIAEYTRAIQIDPEYKWAYLSRGSIYSNLKLYKAAITDFTIAVEIDPEYNSSYMYRGRAKENLGLPYCSDYKKGCDLGIETCCKWYIEDKCDSVNKKNINERNSPNFKVFVNAFIDDCLSLSNFHESYSNSSPIISKYISSKFSTGYYFNPGAECYFSPGPGSITFPDGEYIMDGLSPETTLYDDDLTGGFCEPTEQPNGLYYNVISRLPGWYDFNDSYEEEYLYHPYKEYNKIVLHRLENGYIEYSIYFIQDKDGKWYLTYLNYCDCSA